MTVETIQDLCHAAPFKRFVIRLTDGRNIRVLHPDFIAIGPRGRTLFVYDEQEHFSIVDVPLITQVEVEQ